MTSNSSPPIDMSDTRGADRAKRRERRAEQQRLRTIVERVGDGIIVASLDGVIRFANPAAERMFGRRSPALCGSPLGFPVVAGESAEIQIIRPGGTAVAAELRVVETDWEGESARLVTLRDITDRKRAAERAEQLEQERMARVEAEAANTAKSEFLAVMSHELRTPLNAVIGYADLLDLGIGGVLSGEQRHHVARIARSGRHLLGLVNEVLDLSKIEAGAFSPQLDVEMAADTANAAVSLVQPLAEAKRVAIRLHSSNVADAAYIGDDDRVRQILVNLLNNAVKFTEADGSIDVRVGKTDKPDVDTRLGQGAFVYWRVSDTGMGIPVERIASIFDPFVQVDTGHTRQKEGSGLGLTISRRLARLMKGDLTVQSEEGKGSTFTLWLPAADAGRSSESRNVPTRTEAKAASLRGLGDVGEALMMEVGTVIREFVTRVRSENLGATAHGMRFSELADHVGTYVADVASILVALDESHGRPSPLLADGTEIQRLVAERHGAQRARLGWSRDDLSREWVILRDAMERIVKQRLRGASDETTRESLAVVRRFVEQGEELSCRALTRFQSTEGDQPS
jgi:signal transduction histidine kinase